MEPLSAENLERLHAALLALREELREFLDSTADGARPVDLEEPIGRLSRMDALQQQSMAKAGRETAKRRLGLVEAALARHGRGEYGDCVECEEPVGLARLEARPEAALCVGCQERREQR